MDEQQIARWVYTNKKRAGATTHYYKNSKCLYLAIRIGDQVYGVIGVPAQKMYWIRLNTVFCCLCLTDALLPWIMPETQKKKEKNAVIAKMNSFGLICCVPYHMICEHRCAQYPGNADMLLSNGKYLDEGTRRQIYTDIYDDAEWLTGVVENLLSITRLNDGRLKFKFTDQLMDEVITEALRHLSSFTCNIDVLVVASSLGASSFKKEDWFNVLVFNIISTEMIGCNSRIYIPVCQ